MWNKVLNYKATISYIIFIIIINTIYEYFPFMTISGALVSTGDLLVGAIYIFRDFAQREIKHYVILAMLFGAIVSFFLADKTMAIASVCAFSVAETIDWAIFTFTGKPLSQRLIWSSMLSAPADSFVFLWIYGPFNIPGMIVLTAAKALGVLLVWAVWKKQASRQNTAASPISSGIA